MHSLTNRRKPAKKYDLKQNRLVLKVNKKKWLMEMKCQKGISLNH